jgi:hypothetical protein
MPEDLNPTPGFGSNSAFAVSMDMPTTLGRREDIMADPIGSVSSSVVGYYDSEAGECRLGDASQLSCSVSSQSSAQGAQRTGEGEMGVGGQAAVEQLVSAQARKCDGDCPGKLVEMLYTCAGATAAVLSTSPTGVLAVVGAFAGGAACGTKSLQAYDHCVEP